MQDLLLGGAGHRFPIIMLLRNHAVHLEFSWGDNGKRGWRGNPANH